MSSLKLITPSTGPPIAAHEARQHLRITGNDDDADMVRKVNAATDFCQRNVSGHRQFMPATYEVSYASFPDQIKLPVPPAQSIKWIKYYDSDGTLTTLASTATSTAINLITPTDDPATIDPAYGSVWPDTRAQANAVTVRWVAGYADRASVPDTIKEAVLLVAGHYFENREGVVLGAPSAELAMSVRSLLNSLSYGHYS